MGGLLAGMYCLSTVCPQLFACRSTNPPTPQAFHELKKNAHLASIEGTLSEVGKLMSDKRSLEKGVQSEKLKYVLQ